MTDLIIPQPMQETEHFFNALYDTLESGNHLYLWTLPDYKTWSFPADNLKEMANAAHAMQDERDVYFGIGGLNRKFESGERLNNNNAGFTPALVMDLDIFGPAHVQTSLPKTAEEALSIIPEFLQPSIVVWSGYGLHAYWLFKEMWFFDTPEENLRASNLSIRLQAYIKSLAHERGWKFDSTADLARVLRVPGTLNHKIPGQDQNSYMTQFNPEIRYDPSELEDLIPDIDFRSEITNHGNFKRLSTDESSDLMIHNCAFLQHCSLNAQTITYGEWLSMLTNVVRGADGIDKCHELSSGDKGRYTPKGTDFRISEALSMNGPQTCNYIQATHGFPCPAGGCGVKAPSSFSLGHIDQARAKVNMIGIPSTDKIFNEDMLNALSIIKRQDVALFAKTKDKLRGTINLRDLESAIKQHTQVVTNSEVAEIQCFQVSDINEEQLQNLTKEGYAINAFGELCGIKYDQNMKPYLVKLANFIAWPIREVVLDNGAERRTDFEIEGILSGSQKLRPVMVSADDFSSMKWLVKEWGLSANIYPGQSVKDKVRHAIQTLARDIKRETILTHMGWRKFDDKWVYLHSGGAIGDSSILVDLKREGLSRYCLPEKGDDTKASVVASMKILKVAPNSVTFPLYGLAFLAPLCEPLRKAGIEPAFIIWLNGLTGSLKSNIAALFLNYFGDFTGKTLPSSFKDTANAIELKSFLTKDSILVVDDFHPTASIKEANNMGNIAQQLLRGYGDRVGRTRMRADTSLRPSYSPQGLCIVTGEDAPNAGQSTTARYMELLLSKGEINFDILNELQANTKVLGQTMRSYIETLDIETLPDKLRNRYVELRAWATKPGQHSRIPETVAWLYLGIEMGLIHAVAVDAITDLEKDDLLKTGWNTLMDLAEKQAMSVDTEQPAKQFISALSEMLSGGSVYTKSYTDTAVIGDSNFIGWNDADYYYLLPIITYNAITKYFSAHGGHFSVSAQTLWRHMEQANAIVVEEDSKQTRRIVKKVVGGERTRVLQLRKSSLD